MNVTGTLFALAVLLAADVVWAQSGEGGMTDYRHLPKVDGLRHGDPRWTDPIGPETAAPGVLKVVPDLGGCGSSCHPIDDWDTTKPVIKNPNGNPVEVPYHPVEAKQNKQGCREALQLLPSPYAEIVGMPSEALSRDIVAASNACMDASTESAIVDPGVADKAVVALVSSDQTVYCMGLLTSDSKMVTSRHCWILKSTGEINPDTPALVGYTLDGQRKIDLGSPAASLVLHRAFDINKDPVSIPVAVTSATGAKALPPLPDVEKVPPQDGVASWLAGPVPILAKSLAVLKASGLTKNPVAVHWREGIRFEKWMEGACRVTKVEGSCVFHQCQSFGGFSGSPLITAAKKVTNPDGMVVEKIAWSAVHAGVPGANEDAWQACGDLAGNDHMDDNVAGNWREQ